MNPETGEKTQEVVKKLPSRGTLFLVALIFGTGVLFGRLSFGSVVSAVPDPIFVNTDPKSGFVNTDTSGEKLDFSLFWKVFGILKEKYVDREELDSQQLFYGAIKGMLAATGDPYTNFFTPEEGKAFQESLTGTFDGIGAEMAMQDGVVTVVAPLEGMPAEAAGVRAGDKVLKVDGESTENLSLDEVVKKIRGPKDTEVKLTLFHEGDQDIREVSVRRGVILVKSVRTETRDGVYIVRVSRFGDDTAGDFEAALKAIPSDAQGVVIDLRNNPGGLLEQAVQMAGYFVAADTVVVQEENSQGEKTVLRSKKQSVLVDLPLVILINQGSASASEILAGALRETREHVTLVGEQSFGKGSVQELIPVTKDTSVKITIAKWLTPKGNQINKVGIAPDEMVELTPEDVTNKNDKQLNRALEILR